MGSVQLWMEKDPNNGNQNKWRRQ